MHPRKIILPLMVCSALTGCLGISSLHPGGWDPGQPRIHEELESIDGRISSSMGGMVSAAIEDAVKTTHPDAKIQELPEPDFEPLPIEHEHTMNLFMLMDASSLLAIDAPTTSLREITVKSYESLPEVDESIGIAPPDPEACRAEIAAKLSRDKQFLLMLAAYGRPDPVDAPVLLPVLRDELRSPISGTRALAAGGLGRLGPAGASELPGLQSALQDSNEVVRLYAARSIWKITGKTEASISTLIEGLRSSGSGIPLLAASFLTEMGPAAEPAVAALIIALSHPNPYVRAHAMYALAAVGPKARDAVPALRLAVADPTNNRRVSLRERDQGGAWDWLKDKERSVRAYAQYALHRVEAQ